MKGTIFNIQKFSVNDGPGIRTVAFFKGCPLHCAWCANPESQLLKPQILWDAKKCQHCLLCTTVCEEHAIQGVDDRIVIDHMRCKTCKKCVSQCPSRALQVEGKLMDVEDVMKQVRQDIDFYEESGGGLTLSGGEFLLQKDFAIALLKQAKAENIHTACETTAYSDDETFLSVLPYLDYLFIDCKHYDDQKHKDAIGVSNKAILKHIETAIATNKEVLVRIPVIPSFNDTLEDAQGFIQVFQKIGVKNVQLLPFHQFGENKYDLLNKEYSLKDAKAYHREDLQDYLQQFVDHNIHAFF